MIRVRANQKWRWPLCAIAAIFTVLLALRLWPARPLSAVPQSTALTADDGRLLRLTLASDGQYRVWLPLHEVSPYAVDALLLKEDQYFYWHPGVNPWAMLRAAWATYANGNQQGGSTLTMQLARRLYGINTRSVTGKFRQMTLALWLEARYSKRAIIEAYVNLAPMGGNIEGIGAASLIYFSQPATRLTPAQALTLAVLPQQPGPRGDFGTGFERARQRLQTTWIATHGKAGLETSGYREHPHDRAQLPFLAPHFADQILGTSQSGSIPSGTVRTTLNWRAQSLLERQIGRYLREVRALGVNNASAILIDRRDMGVRALVGSADYFDAAIDGQVNGAAGKRSPGSTLKPILYGLAIDQGLIHPHSILRDTPTAFGPFQPENFDGRFQGPVTAAEALTRSRNLPAVWLASQLKRPNLYDVLREVGVSDLQSEEHYGLALTLGGGEITMEELAGLYAILGNGGTWQPLRWTSDQPSGDAVRVLSPEAAWITLDMLNKNPRPERVGTAGRTAWQTAWKTGTSWGFRDAWTAGIVGDYVLIVWLGNFDGHGNPALVGVDMAAPLFFRIADALPFTLQNEHPQNSPMPVGVKKVAVCAESGDLPNAWCKHTEDTWFIPGKSPIRVSTLHRPVLIDNHTGQRACPPFDPAQVHTEIFEFWSSDMLRVFREAGIPRRIPPPLCAHTVDNQEPPRIGSPLTGVTYTLRSGDREVSIALQASASADAHQLYWFDDRDYLGKTSPGGGGLPWRPDQAGWHALSVVDDLGRSTSRDVRIEIREK